MSYNNPDNIKLEKLLPLVARKLNRGRYQNWKNKDYENLSFEIHVKTKVLISPATLKRIFGKVKTEDNYSPQETTLNALCIYASYTTEQNKAKNKKKTILVIAILLCLGLLFILFYPSKKKITTLKGEVRLEKIEGKGPATAFFNINIPKVKDSIFIDYGDLSYLQHFNPGKYHKSHFYAFPGYFNVKLKTRSKTICKPIKVFIPTDGNKALAHYFEVDHIDRYYPIPVHKNTKEGIFHASRKSLSSLGIDSTKIVVVRLDNYKKTNANGDSFTYQAKVKNNSFWPGIRCFAIHCTIKGTKGQIQVKLVGQGCSHHAHYYISGISKSGSEYDLSNLSVDLKEWSEITIQNDNKSVNVMLGDRLIINERYFNSIGKIIGTTILFHGSGSVDYYRLFDSKGNPLIVEEF